MSQVDSQWRTLAGLRAAAGAAAARRQLVVDEPAAAFGKDRRQADQARAVLLAAVGRESSDAAAVWGDGAKDCRLAGGDGLDAGGGCSENQTAGQ